MKTKVITIHPEIKDDLKYLKYYVDDVWNRPFCLRETPLDVDVELEYQQLRQQVINESVNGAKIISISSEMVYDAFSPKEEITINYE